LVGVIGHEPEDVLHEFTVLPADCPGPSIALTDEGIVKEAANKAEDKNSFFIIKNVI
tara:strand:+ start:535 stop:705 length:171 start_codon:yes stop_codon:yes gene_type:complete